MNEWRKKASLTRYEKFTCRPAGVLGITVLRLTKHVMEFKEPMSRHYPPGFLADNGIYGSRKRKKTCPGCEPAKQSHTITLPPPCLTVSIMLLLRKCSLFTPDAAFPPAFLSQVQRMLSTKEGRGGCTS